jgi:hypothetical protein
MLYRPPACYITYAKLFEFLPDWADAEVLVEKTILPIDETAAPDAELIRDALAEYFTS